MTRESDPSLRHLERDAAIACVAMALAALAIQRGDPSGALGVVGGGALMAFSFRAIRGGVDGVLGARPAAGDAPPPTAGAAWAIVRFVLRYGVIGLAAWLLLVKLHAHPLGVFAGVTAPVIAIGIEAVRLTRTR